MPKGIYQTGRAIARPVCV